MAVALWGVIANGAGAVMLVYGQSLFPEKLGMASGRTMGLGNTVGAFGAWLVGAGVQGQGLSLAIDVAAGCLAFGVIPTPWLCGQDLAFSTPSSIRLTLAASKPGWPSSGMARKDPKPSFSGLSCTARTSKRGGMGDGPCGTSGAIGRPAFKTTGARRGGCRRRWKPGWIRPSMPWPNSANACASPR